MKKLLASFLTFTLFSTLLISAKPVAAQTLSHQVTPIKSITSTQTSQNELQFTPSTSAVNFTKYMFSSGLIKEFSTDKNGNLILKDTLSNIKAKYNLDNTAVENLKLILANGKKKNVSPNQNTMMNKDGSISPQIFYSHGNIYFDNSDILCFLLDAAEIGPTAMLAALDAVATLTGGPAATAIITVLGIIGLPSLASFCYNCIQAACYDEGAYIGIQWNGIFPNIVSGTW